MLISKNLMMIKTTLQIHDEDEDKEIKYFTILLLINSMTKTYI